MTLLYLNLPYSSVQSHSVEQITYVTHMKRVNESKQAFYNYHVLFLIISMYLPVLILKLNLAKSHSMRSQLPGNIICHYYYATEGKIVQSTYKVVALIYIYMFRGSQVLWLAVPRVRLTMTKCCLYIPFIQVVSTRVCQASAGNLCKCKRASILIPNLKAMYVRMGIRRLSVVFVFI